MGKWKVSGIVTDETPDRNDGLVTLVEGMTWDDEVPVTLDMPGRCVIGSIKLGKAVVDGRSVVLGEGVIDLGPNSKAFTDTLIGLARLPIGFAMCGLIQPTSTGTCTWRCARPSTTTAWPSGSFGCRGGSSDRQGPGAPHV